MDHLHSLSFSGSTDLNPEKKTYNENSYVGYFLNRVEQVGETLAGLHPFHKKQRIERDFEGHPHFGDAWKDRQIQKKTLESWKGLRSYAKKRKRPLSEVYQDFDFLTQSTAIPNEPEDVNSTEINMPYRRRFKRRFRKRYGYRNRNYGKFRRSFNYKPGTRVGFPQSLFVACKHQDTRHMSMGTTGSTLGVQRIWANGCGRRYVASLGADVSSVDPDYLYPAQLIPYCAMFERFCIYGMKYDFKFWVPSSTQYIVEVVLIPSIQSYDSTIILPRNLENFNQLTVIPGSKYIRWTSSDSSNTKRVTGYVDFPKLRGISKYAYVQNSNYMGNLPFCQTEIANRSTSSLALGADEHMFGGAHIGLVKPATETTFSHNLTMVLRVRDTTGAASAQRVNYESSLTQYYKLIGRIPIMGLGHDDEVVGTVFNANPSDHMDGS